MQYELKSVMIGDILIPNAPVQKALQQSLFETEVPEDPIRLRPRGDKYEVVNGRRRVVALLENGYEGPIPALVEEMSDERAHWLALTLNSGTSNELDEAEHIVFLLGQGFTQKQVAKRVGFSTATVSQRLRLYELLVPEWKERLRRGEVRYTPVLTITQLPADNQRELLNGKLTQKEADLAVGMFKSSLVSSAFGDDEPAIKPGLFLRSDQVEKLLVGEQLTVSWDGRDLTLSAYQSPF